MQNKNYIKSLSQKHLNNKKLIKTKKRKYKPTKQYLILKYKYNPKSQNKTSS